jgi:retinol-binding protein 3
MPKVRHLLVAFAWLALQCGGVLANTLADAAERRELIARIGEVIEQRYVFPDMARRIRAELADAEFQRRALAAADGPALAGLLTETLQQLSADKHLRVRHSPTPLPDDTATGPGEAQLAEALRQAQRSNFGIQRVERLPGNIGYLELNAFNRAQWAGEALAAAMTLLSHSEALIVDLRNNRGGDPATVALLSSYLFDRRTHLNDLYFRPTDLTTQFWTHDWVPGRRFGGQKPVYVLISNRTFSAAEEFSHNLLHLKRATLVGETTAGGAHPGEFRKVGRHFSLFVSTGRAINPISKGNWEGSGVPPHVATPAADALRRAQLLALPAIAAATEDPPLREAIERRIAELSSSAP